jgi:ubiquinone/menaquinone biosynthesis C-methylase UbiE
LDVGCGPGLLPALLVERGCRAIGVDLDFAPRPSRLHPALVQADALRLPFAPAAFDLITASNMLFLLPDPQAALAEMARLLLSGGLLALLNPSERMSVAAATTLADKRELTGLDRQSLLDWAARAEAHPRWGEAEIRRLLETAGFEIIESVLKVGPGLARWVKAARAK